MSWDDPLDFQKEGIVLDYKTAGVDIDAGNKFVEDLKRKVPALGICADGGEFTEVVKKIVFQGKPVNEENIFHMKRELGDIMWYVAQACMALDTDFNEIIEMNVEKLKARYPGGEFDVHYSENRKEGDL